MNIIIILERQNYNVKINLIKMIEKYKRNILINILLAQNNLKRILNKKHSVKNKMLRI